MDPTRRAARDALIEKLKGDEEITIETEEGTGMGTSGAIPTEEKASYKTGNTIYEENGDGGHTHAPQEVPDTSQVPAEIVVDILASKLANAEKELAIREARILILEAHLRAAHQQ